MNLTGLASEVHHLLVEMDPSRWKNVTLDGLRAERDAANAHADRCLSRWEELPTEFVPDASLKGAVRALQHALSPAHNVMASQADVLRLRDELSPLYEALATALRRHGRRVDSLHPTNYRRTAFHILSGVIVVAACEAIFTPLTAVLVAGTFSGLFWTLEVLRRKSPQWNQLLMQLFRPIARDHERYRVNSSTWYTTALLLISLTAFNPAGMLGILALAVGDPAAGFIGRNYGRIRLMRGKSLEGTLAFAAAAGVAGFVYVFFFYRGAYTPSALLLMPALAAVSGAVAELLSTRMDDNFTVPLASGWTALLVHSLGSASL